MLGKVILVSGSRAEYALLIPLIKLLERSKDIEFYLILTGMHLSHEFGQTEYEVHKDGFKVDDKVEMLLSSNSKVGMTKATGLGFIGFADSFEKIKPDLLMCLGDRFEIFAAAYSAGLMNIPVAHIHGGELTYGAVDEKLRHAITKVSSIHFPTTEDYRKRIIQMGEQPESVINVGALGVERVYNEDSMTLEEIENETNLDLSRGFFLVTIHPPTIGPDTPFDLAKSTIDALEHFPDMPVIMSYANIDSGGYEINQIKNKFCSDNPKKRFIKRTLGHKLYTNCMKNASVVIGNSSSAVIEAPILGVPSINIGNRQEGRIVTDTVFSVNSKTNNIIGAIKKAMSLEKNRKYSHPFGKGNTSNLILESIKVFLKMRTNSYKRFYDL